MKPKHPAPFGSFFSLLLICSFAATAMAQMIRKETVTGLKPVSPDCYTAIKIPLVKKGIYGPTVPPQGFGQRLEFKTADRTSLYSFAQEHNTAWYYFDVQQDGELALEIIPEKQGDDYDFLLFKWQDTICCNSAEMKTEIPIRSNLSRSGKKSDGHTGLSANATGDYKKAGPGETFSRSIPVKKKERYFLVLDNVTPNGGGHTIKLYYQNQAQFGGTVTDDAKKPLKAEVVIRDLKGKLIQRTESDPASGKFSLGAGLSDGGSYVMTVYNDSCFFKSKLILADSIAKSGYRMDTMKIALPRLVEGKKYLMDLVNFDQYQPVLYGRAYVCLDVLVQLLRKNKKMKIRIEGHANDPFGNVGEESCKILSVARTRSVCMYLLSQKIEKGRILQAGHGRDEMLFPNAINQQENEANRRVEITVMSLK